MSPTEIEEEITRLLFKIETEKDKYKRQDAAELLLDLINRLPDEKAITQEII